MVERMEAPPDTDEKIILHDPTAGPEIMNPEKWLDRSKGKSEVAFFHGSLIRPTLSEPEVKPPVEYPHTSGREITGERLFDAPQIPELTEANATEVIRATSESDQVIKSFLEAIQSDPLPQPLASAEVVTPTKTNSWKEAPLRFIRSLRERLPIPQPANAGD